jgi:hypothetical protein
VAVPFWTSKTFCSFLRAVSSSTINEPSWCIIFFLFFRGHQLLVGDAIELPQLPNRSLNPGLRGGWYQPSSSEFEVS